MPLLYFPYICMNKISIAPENLVIGANRELKILEIREKSVLGVDYLGGMFEVNIEDLKGSPIDEAFLNADGFSQRSITTKQGKLVDYIKQIKTLDGKFLTISILPIAFGWEIEIKDEQFQVICTGKNIKHKHTYQNLVAAYV